MNIIEALRTGKDLRRPIGKHYNKFDGKIWFSPFVIADLLTGGLPEGRDKISLNKYDLMADDWEVKEDPKDNCYSKDELVALITNVVTKLIAATND